MNLETDFLNDFKNKEKEYFKFYRENVSSITIFLLYVNINNELVYVKKNKKKLTNNTFDENMFFSIIKKNRYFNKKKYIFDSCNQYNFNLLPENVENFVLNENVDNYYFMTTYCSIEEIKFDKTIDFFSELNSLYFLFKEEPNGNNKTKRIFINTNKKTRKNKNSLNLLTLLD